jgi:hypothetical protein
LTQPHVFLEEGGHSRYPNTLQIKCQINIANPWGQAFSEIFSAGGLGQANAVVTSCDYRENDRVAILLTISTQFTRQFWLRLTVEIKP